MIWELHSKRNNITLAMTYNITWKLAVKQHCPGAWFKKSIWLLDQRWNIIWELYVTWNTMMGA